MKKFIINVHKNENNDVLVVDDYDINQVINYDR